MNRNLTFIKDLGTRIIITKSGNKKIRRYYLIKCFCGREFEVRKDFYKKQAKSCGCLRKGENISKKLKELYSTRNGPRTLKMGNSTENAIYRSYKDSAKRRNYDFCLTKEETLKLFQGNCYYCGVSPCNTTKMRGYINSFTYNGIDRLDNSKGYLIENCVSCCKYCNSAKKQMKENDFIKWIEKVYNYLKLKNKI